MRSWMHSTLLYCNRQMRSLTEFSNGVGRRQRSLAKASSRLDLGISVSSTVSSSTNAWQQAVLERTKRVALSSGTVQLTVRTEDDAPFVRSGASLRSLHRF